MERPKCPPYKFWRDPVTCVDETDCFCKSHEGEPVIPGAVIKESECEICQCINNYYTCDKSLCISLNNQTSTEKPVTYLPTEATTSSL